MWSFLELMHVAILPHISFRQAQGSGIVDFAHVIFLWSLVETLRHFLEERGCFYLHIMKCCAWIDKLYTRKRWETISIKFDEKWR
jgi:hypothetical protein